jgi:hypothetical protein
MYLKNDVFKSDVTILKRCVLEFKQQHETKIRLHFYIHSISLKHSTQITRDFDNINL